MKEPWVFTLISEIKAVLQGKGTSAGLCFFLGAGADITSGGVLFSDLKRRCLLRQGIPLPQHASQLMVDSAFDDYFCSLTEDERCIVLESLLRETRGFHPSDGYRLLALMAREKIISSVVTTNFDNLMEQTESDMGISAFQLYAPGISIPASYLIKRSPSKAVYLKMHGDVDGRCVTHLTNEEINNRSYQDEYKLLLQHLLTHSTVVIAGYSGYDSKIAEIFEENIGQIQAVYWCNPSSPNPDAPLVKVLNNAQKIRYIKSNFDAFVETIACEIFKERMIFHADSIFIWSLIKTKIKKLQEIYEENVDLPHREICVPRTLALQEYDYFLTQAEKNLCIVSGSQGSGKSVFISQLLSRNESDNLYVIPISAPSALMPDASAYLVENLGYITANPMIVIYQLAEWLQDNKKDIVVVFDSIGNGHASRERITSYLSIIIELAYILRHVSNLKFLVSLRDEVWDSVVHSLDQNYLHQILWASNRSYNVTSIHINYFTEDELCMALQLSGHYLSDEEISGLSDEISDLLRVPFFFGLALKSRTVLDTIMFSAGGLLPAIEHFFDIKIYSFGERKLLQNIALKMLEANNPNLNTIDIDWKSIRSLNQILNITADGVSFRHPLLWEYYLVCSYRVKQICKNPSFTDFEWIKSTFLSEDTHSTIQDSFILYLTEQQTPIDYTCNFFLKLVDRSRDNPSMLLRANKIIGQVLDIWAKGRTEELLQWVKFVDPQSEGFKLLAQRLIYCSNYMDDANAYIFLDMMRARCANTIALECYVLINDRFSAALTKTAAGEEKEYFRKYAFALRSDSAIGTLVQMVWLMGKIGLDNTQSDQYERLARCIKDQILSLQLSDITKENAVQLKEGFLRNAYMIFFNANNNLEEKYYCFALKSKTAAIIRTLLDSDQGISLQSLYSIRQCVDHFDETIEFFICNLLFVLSMQQDPVRAIREFDTMYSIFNDDVNVLELDFYLSALFMSVYVANPRDRTQYLARFQRTISDYETLLFTSPACERTSSCRRFADRFDLEFEDGFNALTNYTYTAPSTNYVSRNKEKQSVEEYLSLYWKLLSTLEETGNYEKILRLLQAVSQMIVNWPEDGFEALEKFAAINHPLIHRGLVRVLSQNYLRYPAVTKRFLRSKSQHFTHDDLLEIQGNSVANIEYRTLEQLQWARMVYFLRTWINPNIVEDVLSVFLNTDTLETALLRIVTLLQGPNSAELVC